MKAPGLPRGLFLLRVLRTLLLLLCIGLLLPGCAPSPPAGPPAPTLLDDLSTLLEKDLLYLGPAGTLGSGGEGAGAGEGQGEHLLLDPADDNRTYLVSGPDAALLDGVPPFSQVSFLLNAWDNTIILSTKVPPDVGRNLPVVAAAGFDEAARLYPDALLDRFLFTALRGGEYAIADYTVTSATVLSHDGHHATIEFVADLKPVSDPFGQAASRWGEPGDDGYVRDRRLVLELYSHDGQYCAYSPDPSNIFTEGAPPVPPTPQVTLYQPPVTYPEVWEALLAGHQVETVLWEDDTHSWITQAWLSGSVGNQYCDMTIYRIERATGQRLALFDLLRDTYRLRPLALRDRTLYLQPVKAAPYSEAYFSHLTSIDLDTGEYTVHLTEQTDVLGKVGDTIYVAQLPGPDEQRAGGVYALDVATGELRRVCDLPGPCYSTAFAGSSLRYYADGRLHVVWPDEGQGEYALYVIDPVLGTVEEEPQSHD